MKFSSSGTGSSPTTRNSRPHDLNHTTTLISPNDNDDDDDTDHLLATIPLLNIGLNRSSYYTTENYISTFSNPLYTGYPAKYDIEVQLGSEMRLKDFLASIPSFSDFSEQQLLLLERRASISKYQPDEIIFYQQTKGDAFYIIHSGAVDIYIQDDLTLLPSDLGSRVNHLTEGCYFGERALMTLEPRAATVKSSSTSHQSTTVCLVFSRQTFEDAISGSNALLGNDINDSIDWSKDHETRSLYRHIEKILKIEKMTEITIKIRRVLYELTTAFTPELSADEVIARMVMTIKIALKGDRVGLFVLSEDRKSMVLKVSERSKGIRLPIKGLAGSVIESNQPMNIPDAYKDERFDNTMDRRTGYRTRQVLGVPVRHPLTGETIGLLQVNNRLDGSHDEFTNEEQGFLEIAAEQLSELLYGRADVFLNAGTNNSTEHTSANDASVAIVNSSDVMTPFQVELISFNFFYEEYVDPSVKYLELVVSLHLGVSQLCHSRSVIVEIPTPGSSTSPDGKSTTSKRRKSLVATSGEMSLNLRNRLIFNIATRDLPRAARILYRVGGSKKKKGPYDPIGWAAAPIYDFKGRMDCQLSVNLFQGDNNVPINTTLTNTHHDRSPSLSAVLCADLILNANTTPSPHHHTATSPRLITVIHSMPKTTQTIQGAVEQFTESSMNELERILLLSFNPLSTQLLTSEDKEFLWSLRYNILDRSELLAAFLMCVQWQNVEHVHEVYELLDLWEPPLPQQALQLLDRRFMDPKIRAYAVHCLEELDDDELALYMLQLCQQLKFENHADSALSRFLLRRSLANKRLIGHMFFWQLQSEAQNIDVRQRFITLLQVTLPLSVPHSRSLSVFLCLSLYPLSLSLSLSSTSLCLSLSLSLCVFVCLSLASLWPLSLSLCISPSHRP
jgi:CRP-like cAMP-binding protein